MEPKLRLLVFTDLDGTLIDHETYEWSAAAQALDALRCARAGVVLASSKTAPEIDAARRDMGLQAWPAIVENGAGILPAHADPQVDGGAYARLRAILDALPDDVRAPFVGFGDMSTQEVARLTGLRAPAAALARQRSHSEPGLWHASPQKRHAFLAQLRAHGVTAQQGGRFLTLSFGATKADQVRTLCRQYRPETTLALGDAPNDVSMLESCDYGVIVANPTSPPLPWLEGERTGRITRTDAAGPVGWNAAVLGLLARLGMT